MKSENLYQLLLHLGDNALISGQRLGDWSSRAHILEEDLALTNMALDYIGRAEMLLKYASEIAGTGTEDSLAFRRNESGYRNFLICELENGNFADTICRQFFLAAYELLYYTALLQSKDERLRKIAFKSVKEIKYHLHHSKEWFIRLGAGTEESKHKMESAIQHIWKFTGEFFIPYPQDAELMEAEICPNNQDLQAEWTKIVTEVFSISGLEIPKNTYFVSGGRKGTHTEAMGHLLTEMQYLQRTYPDAVWQTA